MVLGSSLTVMSGLRFVRHNAKQATGSDHQSSDRGDELASLKIDRGCSETLTELRAALLG